MKNYSLVLSALLWIAMCTSCSKENEKACFVILPDTQTYLELCPEVFETQFDWIVENRDKIDAVLQVGDLTQENYPAEWWLAKKQFNKLSEAGIPYTIALGNHDIGSRPFKYADTYNTTTANTYFPLSELKAQPYFGESEDDVTIDNHYITLRAGGMDFLILTLVFGPSDEVLHWANKVVDQHPEKHVIINTHAYMYSDSTRMTTGHYWLPQNYGIGKEEGRTVNDGESIWNKFVSRHPNIVAVFSGHVLNSGVGTLVSEGVEGNKVYQMLANFQRGVKDSRLGGEGYLRIVTFDKKAGTIDVKTYSTLNKEFHPSKEHNFSFEGVAY